MSIKKAAIDDFDSLAELFDSYRVFYKQEPNLQGFFKRKTTKGGLSRFHCLR